MIKEKLKEIGKMLATTDEKTEGESFIELGPTGDEKRTAKILLKCYVLRDFSDIKDVIDDIRTGYIIGLMKIKALKEKNVNELKRSIDKLKKTCIALEGDLVGLDENWVLAVPSYVDIKKTE